MDAIIQHKEKKDGVFVETHKHDFRIVEDKQCGDWCLIYSHQMQPTLTYFTDKAGAINKILEEIGILEDPDYEVAPDKTSA